MRLSLNELRSIVSDIVRDELREAVDHAVERRMGSMAARIVAEAAKQVVAAQPRSVVQPRAAVVQHVRERQQQRHPSAPAPRRESIFENVLRDTAQTTLLSQRDADDHDVAPPADASLNDKFERLAFTANTMPTRSSTVPQLANDQAAQ